MRTFSSFIVVNVVNHIRAEPADLLLKMSRAMSSTSVASLGRRSFVSQSGLVNISKELKDLGEIESSVSRRQVKRARDKEIDLRTTSGSLVQ